MLTHLAYSTLGERRYGEKEGENATLARKKKKILRRVLKHNSWIFDWVLLKKKFNHSWLEQAESQIVDRIYPMALKYWFIKKIIFLKHPEK